MWSMIFHGIKTNNRANQMSIWGRLLGGAAGFALGGPIGAILGVMAGSAFDKKNKSSFNYSKISQEQKQQVFTISFIILSAKLAKSDGQVTNDESGATDEVVNVTAQTDYGGSMVAYNNLITGVSDIEYRQNGGTSPWNTSDNLMEVLV